MLKTGPSFFFRCSPPQFYSVFGIFENTNSVTLCQNSVFLQHFGDVKNEVFENSLLCWSNRNRKKRKKKVEKAKNPIKIVFFKNCLTLVVSGREKKRAFSCTLSVLAKNVFWPTTV